MSFKKANNKYNSTLTADYTVGDTTFGVAGVPTNTPTIITVARGTSKETRFTITGTGTGQLTGVARLDGANENIAAGSSVECMNDSDFINQLSSAVFDQAALKGLVYAADGGSDDAYAITLPVAPTALTDLVGVPIVFKANTANTGACTLNVNTLGAKTIKKFNDQDLADNDIEAGQIVTVVYDGTNFQMQTTPQTVTQEPYGMSRQAIMNGNFDVWQRGTSVTPADAANTFLADRWADYINKDSGTLPTLTRSRQAHTSGDIDNSFYFTRLATNGAGTSLGANSQGKLFQKIENGTRLLCGAGKKVTVSFYARSSIANKRIGLSLYQDYGSGGSPTATEAITGTPITLTSSWVKYTATFTTNTLVGKTFGTANDDSLQVLFHYMWGTTYGNTYVSPSVTAETFVGSGTIDIAQVQLCAGDVALPFQPKSFDQELAACQRYYQQSYSEGVAAGTVTNVGRYALKTAFTGNYHQTQSILFPVTMRIAPSSSSIYSTETGTVGKIRDTSATADVNGLVGDCYANTMYVYVNNVSIAADHLLAFHYVVSAEL